MSMKRVVSLPVDRAETVTGEGVAGVDVQCGFKLYGSFVKSALLHMH